MMKYILLMFFMMPSMTLTAQTTKTYRYNYNSAQSIATFYERDTVEVRKLKKINPGNYEQTLKTNSGEYVYGTDKQKKFNLYYLKNNSGEHVASLSSGSMQRDITLSDGTVYKWQKIDQKNWLYSRDGRTLLSGSISKVNRVKMINYSIHDEDDEGLPLVMALSAVYSAQQIKKRESQPFVLGSIVALAIFRSITSN